MKKSTIFALAIYFIAFALPIIGMMNCSGWNEGSMAVKSCAVDSPFLRSYANFYYGWLLLSAFMIGAPILAYGGIIVFITRFISKKFIKN
jgi:hypothetical protein